MCKIEGCNGKHFGRGWCYLHYARWWKTGDPGPVERLRPNKRDPICQVEGCGRRHAAKGYCACHYERWRTYGVVDDEAIAEIRFWAKVNKDGPNGCWLWLGARDRLGYAQVGFLGRTQMVHRRSYELLVGPIPDGLVLDHLCRNPSCVNPEHLEPVTQKENVHRGFAPPSLNAQKTHCPQGHPYDEANTYIIPSTGGRMCRQCLKVHHRESARRKRAERRSA